MLAQPGDLFAVWGADRASRIITWGTATPFAPRGLRLGPSHVAICAEHPRLGRLWCESSTLSLSPCWIRGECVDGCQSHPIARRRFEIELAGGRVEHFRLSPIASLTTAESGLLSDILFKHFICRGVRYDWGHVLLAGTRVFKRTRLMPAETLDAVFCSELVAACLMQLGRLGRSNPTRYSPADLLRELVRNGTYQRVADDQPQRVGNYSLYREAA